jgi:hypothetical protein
VDRKEFLRGCAGGLCICAATCLPLPGEAADTAKEDWRVPYVRQRYAKLLDMLSQRMNGDELVGLMHDLGSFCSETGFAAKVAKFRGDTDGFMKFFGQGNVTAVRSETGFFVTYSPPGDCGCPLNSRASKTPGVTCECSVGWNRHIWGIVLEREPKVVLKDSMVRGGKHCVFEITPV